jgi:hypothetical protein
LDWAWFGPTWDWGWFGPTWDWGWFGPTWDWGWFGPTWDWSWFGSTWDVGVFGRLTTSWSREPVISSVPRWSARWHAEHWIRRLEGSCVPPSARCTMW